MEIMSGYPDHAVAEAAAIAKTAVALAGGSVHAFTRELIEKMGRGEVSGDEAAEALRARFVKPHQPA